MKVTKTQSQPAFQPIELKITIENAEELRVLKDITCADAELLFLLLNSGIIDSKRAQITEDIIGKIHKAL